ncbi:putative MFS family arabinose efflux permease [Tenacibaculum gallaicum]|uniref:Putative MFS family arabinose efflux permease n=1 Tax=Tenacibaculum gallaicum TaxID=561505 RepID=A0A3E0ICJ6_9FLAO|nr:MULTISPECIES: MFS transporter [Tenacibaculum]MDO6673969.1 MFS transporter [Tenacibaculum sp. 1_MG-2023]MDX8552297.1 MFS transporter [Tenacibaculum sp. 1B UA]REH56303.1 putative MFS family arabinose efflux permease [Tenacibaculum gallaicum]
MEKKDPYASLRIKEFNIFLLVRFALVFAWSMQFIIIEWQVYSITKNPLSLGIIGLMEVIPAVSMALFAGHIVDQKEKRNLLALCIGLFSLISLGLFFLTLPSFIEGWNKNTVLYAIYALVFFGGLLRSFFGPTIFSLIALIVPKKLYPNAATWSSSTWQIASVLGPAFAGFTISWIGVHWSLCVVFGLVSISFLTVFFIKKKPILNPKIGEPVMKSLKEGVRFVYKTKAILGALTLDMISVLFGGAVALLPVYAQDILKVGPEGFGALRAAPAIGAFLTMLITAYIPISRNAGMKLLAAIFGFGICIIVFGLSSVFWISIVALFFSGVTDGVSMVIRQTILQLKTPDHMRGRVASVNSMFVGSSNELGAFESGVTAKLMGTVTAVVFGGTMTLITVITTGVLNPTLRKLDLTKDLEEHEKEE